jgi:hypothetical protein
VAKSIDETRLRGDEVLGSQWGRWEAKGKDEYQHGGTGLLWWMDLGCERRQTGYKDWLKRKSPALPIGGPPRAWIKRR